jgi:CheY-like chemotaxis protein
MSAAQRRQRVLVVDDDRSVREFFRRTLLFAGFDVVVASGGGDGLHALGADPDIALVLLDLDMPRIDGRRFREVQRSDERLAATPTVIVTGMMLTDALRAELGATAYVTKPIGPGQLVALVERYCARVGDQPLPLSH